MKTSVSTGLVAVGVMACLGAGGVWDSNMVSPSLTMPRALGRVDQFAVLKSRTLAGDQVAFTIVDTVTTNTWSLTSTSMDMTWHLLGPSVKMTFNPTNHALERMVIDLVSREGSRISLIDANGDGMPDERVLQAASGGASLAEPRRQVFYQGAFLDCVGAGEVRSVRFRGRDVQFRFVGGTWEPAAEVEKKKDVND